MRARRTLPLSACRWAGNALIGRTRSATSVAADPATLLCRTARVSYFKLTGTSAAYDLGHVRAASSTIGSGRGTSPMTCYRLSRASRWLVSVEGLCLTRSVLIRLTASSRPNRARRNRAGTKHTSVDHARRAKIRGLTERRLNSVPLCRHDGVHTTLSHAEYS